MLMTTQRREWKQSQPMTQRRKLEVEHNCQKMGSMVERDRQTQWCAQLQGPRTPRMRMLRGE